MLGHLREADRAGAMMTRQLDHQPDAVLTSGGEVQRTGRLWNRSHGLLLCLDVGVRRVKSDPKRQD
jgi:hypothetical protein